MNLGLITIGLIGYVIGAVPTAWLLRRFTSGSDLRSEGSGNLGAMNLAEVSENKWLGIAAGVIDCLKGMAAIGIASLIHNDWFAAKAWAGVGAVLGHNYNAFLKFKGGRGLATVLGVGLVTNPLFVFTWGIMYLTGYYVIRKDIHAGSMTATIGTILLVFSFPERVIRETMLVTCYEAVQARFFVFALLFPVFLRLVPPIQQIFAAESAND